MHNCEWWMKFSEYIQTEASTCTNRLVNTKIRVALPKPGCNKISRWLCSSLNLKQSKSNWKSETFLSSTFQWACVIAYSGSLIRSPDLHFRNIDQSDLPLHHLVPGYQFGSNHKALSAINWWSQKETNSNRTNGFTWTNHRARFWS